jgi:transcriptional regulator GlxA family with amidase domain
MAGLVGFLSLLPGRGPGRLGDVRTVLIVLFDEVQSLDVTGPLEVFATARRDGRPAYQVRTASLGGGLVRTSSGLAILPDGDLRDLSGLTDLGEPREPGGLTDRGEPGRALLPDLLIVPGGRGARRRPPELVDWLRRHAPAAQRVASVCTGAFLLAEAGLLDGRRVTTHWSRCDDLRRQYPAVEVDPDPIFIKDGRVATSAGITAGIDLALALVEDDLGRDEALAVARALVVFLRRPGNQAQFSAQLSAQVAQRAPLRDVQQWIAEHPADDLTVEALASRASLSPRHFARAFAAEVGMPPGRYVERVRLETARRHLEDSTAGIEQTARASGYRTTEAMRRAFTEALGVSPAEYRRRFRPVLQ